MGYPQSESFGVGQVIRRLGYEVPTHLSVTADYTLLISDCRMVHVDATAGPLTITLPTPVEGLEYHFSEVAGLGTAITLDSGAGKTINGVQMLTMNAAYRQRKLRAISATAWIVVGSAA